MATTAGTRTISGLARAMVQHGLLTEYDADTLQGQATASSIGFVEQIVLSKKMSSAQVAMFASRAFGAPLLDLTGFDFDLIDKELVDPRIAAIRRVLPLHKRGNRLFVAVSDPATCRRRRIRRTPNRRGDRRGRGRAGRQVHPEGTVGCDPRRPL
jgi:type IV pilus assembly protein PilB